MYNNLHCQSARGVTTHCFKLFLTSKALHHWRKQHLIPALTRHESRFEVKDELLFLVRWAVNSQPSGRLNRCSFREHLRLHLPHWHSSIWVNSVMPLVWGTDGVSLVCLSSAIVAQSSPLTCPMGAIPTICHNKIRDLTASLVTKIWDRYIGMLLKDAEKKTPFILTADHGGYVLCVHGCTLMLKLQVCCWCIF